MVSNIIHYLTKNGALLHFALFVAGFFTIGVEPILKCSSFYESEYAKANEEFIDRICESVFKKDMEYIRFFVPFNMFASTFLLIPLLIWATFVEPLITSRAMWLSSAFVITIPNERRTKLINKEAKDLSCKSWILMIALQAFCELLAMTMAGLNCYFGLQVLTSHLETWDQVDFPFFPQRGSCSLDFDEFDIHFYGVCTIRNHWIYEFFYFVLVAFYVLAAFKIIAQVIFNVLACFSRRMKRKWLVKEVSNLLGEEELKVIVDNAGIHTIYALKIYASVADPEYFLRLVTAYKNLQMPRNKV